MARATAQNEIDVIDDKMYFGVIVKDSDGRPIKDAKAHFDGGHIEYTKSDGKASTWFYLDEAPEDQKLSCVVSKTGYYDKAVITRGNPSGATYYPVTLEAIYIIVPVLL